MSEARNDVERNWGEHSPSYYRAMAIQPTDYIVANKLEYLPASIVKYASRAGRKPGEPALKDAKKCLAFAKRWVAELEAGEATSVRPMSDDERKLVDLRIIEPEDLLPKSVRAELAASLNEMAEERKLDLAAVAQSCVAPKAG